MYTTAEEDRSDLYLAAAVYVLGPTILDILLEFLPRSVMDRAGLVLRVLVTVATTVLVPFLLIRYRKERLSSFGADGSMAAFAYGLLLALPVAVAYVAAGFAAGLNGTLRVPVVEAVTEGSFGMLLLRVVAGLCLVLLGVYTTVKARTAFRADPGYLRPIAVRVGRYVAIAGAIASVLLFVSFVMQDASAREALEFIVVPLGVAAAAFLVYRGLRDSQLSSQPVLLTPMVVLAISSLVILGGAFNFVFGIWRGAMLAALGLVVGALMESRRSAMGPLGLGVGLSLLTPLIA